MSLKQLYTVLVLVGVMAVSGCGFKLRGMAEPLPAEIRQLTLVGIVQGSDFYRGLSQALIGAGAVLDPVEGQSAQLTIHRVAQSRDEISESGGQTLYRANFAVTFSLSRGEQEKLIDMRQLRTTREFSFDSNNPYGLEQQDSLLRGELQRDLIQQLIHQIRAAGSAKVPARESGS